METDEVDSRTNPLDDVDSPLKDPPPTPPPLDLRFAGIGSSLKKFLLLSFKKFDTLCSGDLNTGHKKSGYIQNLDYVVSNI